MFGKSKFSSSSIEYIIVGLGNPGKQYENTRHKIPPENVIIMFDDISLDVGRIRIRRSGSDGGQNGVKNIIYLSGSDKFPRVKIGIGKKPHPEYDLKDWVLSRFSKEDMKTLNEALDNAAESAALMVDGKTDLAMQKYN